MRANRPHIIIIQARATVEDGYGGEMETWGEYAREYAAIFYGSGSEQREAAQTNGSQAASFEVLANSKTRAISVTDHRINYGGGLWNITATQPLDNGGVRITAVRAAA